MKLYSIIYDDRQVAQYTPYDNTHVRTVEQKSYLFEYNAMLQLEPTFEDEEYYGIFSCRFDLKTGLRWADLQELLHFYNYEKYDLITLCRPLPMPYLYMSELHHPGFTELLTLICEKIGLAVIEPRIVIYSNQFIAKAYLYRNYINEILRPSIELLDGEFRELAFRDSKYKINKDIEKTTGLPYYTMHTFILERLLSLYIENMPIKILQLLP